jgi:hypothetical protein
VGNQSDCTKEITHDLQTLGEAAIDPAPTRDIPLVGEGLIAEGPSAALARAERLTLGDTLPVEVPVLDLVAVTVLV